MAEVGRTRGVFLGERYYILSTLQSENVRSKSSSKLELYSKAAHSTNCARNVFVPPMQVSYRVNSRKQCRLLSQRTVHKTSNTVAGHTNNVLGMQ